MRRYILLIIVAIILQGCSSKEASHLPSVFELPGAYIANSVGNAIYNNKRKKVKSYVVAHYDTLRSEVYQAKGAHLHELMFKANINKTNYLKVQKQLKNDYTTMFNNIDLNSEVIMHIFSSLYLPKKTTKTIHGLTYNKAYRIVTKYLKDNFETFRLSLKHKNTETLHTLAKKLHIVKEEKRELFYTTLFTKYDSLFIEPVVVAVMARSIN